MGLYKIGLMFLVLSLLNTETIWAKRGGSSGGRKTSSSSSSSSSSRWGGTQSKPSSHQPGSYPRQPQSPNRNNNPYPAGGSYPHPGGGNTNQGGYPKQNPPSYPGGGSNPNQNPAGGYPAGGGYPNQNPGRGNYPNQYPGAGSNPAAGGYPAGAGYPNQNPGRGNYPNQYPAAGGNPNQYPGRAGYPNQYPAGGSYPNQNPGMNPQYPGAGGYPAAGGYPNQYPSRGGVNSGGYPYQYPGAGGYPVRGGNTGQGWGVPGANPGGYPGSYPGSYPGGGIGGYPNWNPNNRILSPRYGGGGYGYGGHGMGGSPFSHSVQNMGYQPKSTGFAKKAMLAAGVGAVAGMAVGYGLGRFPRPHFTFRNPEEEYYYNNYMYRQYGRKSTDEKDFGRDYVYQPPPRAESYESFMKRCMNDTVPPKSDSSSSSTSKPGSDEDDDTVSIEEIGYPALIEQVKSKRCLEQYMIYSEEFLQQRKFEQQVQPNHSSSLSHRMIQLFTSCFMLLSCMLLQ